jgi:hypothetical protein
VEIFKKTGSEIGKKAAEKSGGLFSADDWHCSRFVQLSTENPHKF